MRRFVSTLLAVSLTFASIARADAPADVKAKADALFKDGRALAKQEKWAEACPKFEESQKLDPAAGTLLNLGVCHARIGKNARAYQELVESLAIALKAKRTDREKIARDELAAIEPKVARVTIDVASPAPSMAVTIDGEILPTAMFGIPRVVDPGEHAIRVAATGRKTWETKIALVAGDRKSVAVAELEVDASAPPPAVASNEAPTTTSATPSTTTSSANATADVVETSGSSKRTIGLVVGGVGVAALGAGLFFGLRASSLDSQKNDAAAQGDAATANDKADQARSAVTIARVGLGVGIVAVGVGAYLFLTSKGEESPKTTGFSVSPAIAPGYGGFALGGAW